MDTDTAAALERGDTRIDSLESPLRSELHEMAGSLRGELHEMAGSLRGEMREMADSLRREFRDGLAENRRHTQFLFESLRDDIRLLAEGFAVLSAKVDSLRR